MALVGTLPWLYGALLAAVHYGGSHLDKVNFPHQRRFASFAAGVTVTYVFLQLLPEHHKGVEFLGNYGFFFALVGFLVLHMMKMLIYRHARTSAELRHDYKELHSVFLFLYYFGIGIVLDTLLQRSLLEGTLFFVPVLFHTSISSMALTELHEDVLDQRWIKISVSLAVLGGVGVAQLIGISITSFHALLGVITGMFLYTAIHDSLPAEGQNEPLSFLAGVVFYSAIIAWTWTLL